MISFSTSFKNHLFKRLASRTTFKAVLEGFLIDLGSVLGPSWDAHGGPTKRLSELILALGAQLAPIWLPDPPKRAPGTICYQLLINC